MDEEDPLHHQFEGLKIARDDLDSQGSEMRYEEHHDQQIHGHGMPNPHHGVEDYHTETSSEQCNLIVNYLPHDIDDNTLRDLFFDCGDIIMTKVVRDKNTKKSLGYGFVKFRNEDDAGFAIQKLNGYAIENKVLKVSVARPPSLEIRNCKLYVTNLPKEYSEREVVELFNEFGDIIECRVLKDRNTRINKGVAFVQFNLKSQANNALSLNGYMLPGSNRGLIVKYAEDQHKKKELYRLHNLTATSYRSSALPPGNMDSMGGGGGMGMMNAPPQQMKMGNYEDSMLQSYYYQKQNQMHPLQSTGSSNYDLSLSPLTLSMNSPSMPGEHSLYLPQQQSMHQVPLVDYSKQRMNVGKAPPGARSKVITGNMQQDILSDNMLLPPSWYGSSHQSPVMTGTSPYAAMNLNSNNNLQGGSGIIGNRGSNIGSGVMQQQRSALEMASMHSQQQQNILSMNLPLMQPNTSYNAGMNQGIMVGHKMNPQQSQGAPGRNRPMSSDTQPLYLNPSQPIKPQQMSNAPGSPATLLINNLPPYTDTQTLHELFSQFGRVLNVSIDLIDPNSKQGIDIRRMIGDNNGPKPLCSGRARIQLATLNQAESAAQALNGAVVFEGYGVIQVTIIMGSSPANMNSNTNNPMIDGG